jgi:hypothetical protein
VAVDRGYIDYEQFRSWNDKGVFFVTRMKSNASYDVVESREVPQKRNIVFDEIIVLTGETTSEKFPGPLRRIVVHDKKKGRGYRAADEPPELRLDHHFVHLQGPVGDRTVLQDPEAEPENEDVHRNERERSSHPDLYSHDRFACFEVAPLSVEIRKVLFESGVDVQNRDSKPWKHRKQFLGSSYFKQSELVLYFVLAR